MRRSVGGTRGDQDWPAGVPAARRRRAGFCCKMGMHLLLQLRSRPKSSCRPRTRCRARRASSGTGHCQAPPAPTPTARSRLDSRRAAPGGRGVFAALPMETGCGCCGPCAPGTPGRSPGSSRPRAGRAPRHRYAARGRGMGARTMAGDAAPASPRGALRAPAPPGYPSGPRAYGRLDDCGSRSPTGHAGSLTFPGTQAEVHIRAGIGMADSADPATGPSASLRRRASRAGAGCGEHRPPYPSRTCSPRCSTAQGLPAQASPINACLGPLLEEAFAEATRAGFPPCGVGDGARGSS